MIDRDEILKRAAKMPKRAPSQRTRRVSGYMFDTDGKGNYLDYDGYSFDQPNYGDGDYAFDVMEDWAREVADE